MAEAIADKVLLLKSDFDDVRNAGYQQGFDDGKNSGGTGGYDQGYNEGYEQGYNKGKDEGIITEYNRFWDSYQGGGNVALYCEEIFAGPRWNDNIYNPKYPIYASRLTRGYYMSNITNTKVPIVAGAKLVNGEIVSAVTGDRLQNAFRDNSSLITIIELVVNSGLQFVHTFNNCTKLKNLAITGKIGRDLNVQWSIELTNESLHSIIWALENYAGTSNEFVYSLTLAENHWTNLDAEGVPTNKDGISTGHNTWKDYVTSLGWNC